jgi:hypothetical protein
VSASPSRLLILGGALLLASCSAGAGKSDASLDRGSASFVDRPATAQLTCRPDPSDCRDFVVSRLLLPTSAADADSWAYRDQSGHGWNALGGVLTALAGLGSGTVIQNAVDDDVYQGATIVLARVQAGAVTSDGSAAAQTWVGAKTSCCPAAATDRQKCKDEALKGCYAGDPPHAFLVDQSAAQSSLLTGALSAGKLEPAAPSLFIDLPLPSAGTMQLTLKAAQLRGVLAEDGIHQGSLAGALAPEEVQQTLIPHVAEMLDGILRDPATSPDLRDFFSTLFDLDKDGHIVSSEVAGSSIKSLLDGDVDVDGDGVKELTLGIGFDAVRAVIQGK